MPPTEYAGNSYSYATLSLTYIVLYFCFPLLSGQFIKNNFFHNFPFRYAVPLFFVCVRANVGYIVVAVFIPENEDTFSIVEALQLIKEFTAQWSPRNFLVDFSLAEIAAIEKTFPSK